MSLVVAHAGAGLHSRKQESIFLDALRAALRAGLAKAESIHSSSSSSLSSSSSSRSQINDASIDAVCESIRLLENAECTNAGVGSNLNVEGEVECDACVVEGTYKTFGSISAVPGLKNPILAARKLLIQQIYEPPLPLGLVKPSMLCGHACLKWARKQADVECHRDVSIDGVLSEYNVTEVRRKSWKTYCERLNEASRESKNEQEEDERHEKRPRIEKREQHDQLYDTVGAIAFSSCSDDESRWKMSAGTSSGGIALKQPGRIGEAAILGSGCYCGHNPETGISVAVSCSGMGEDITQNSLALRCCDALGTGEEAAAVADDFYRAWSCAEKRKPLFGYVAVRCIGKDDEEEEEEEEEAKEEEDAEKAENEVEEEEKEEPPSIGKRLEILWSHTTESMAVGFFASGMKEPWVCISRLPNSSAGAPLTSSRIVTIK